MPPLDSFSNSSEKVYEIYTLKDQSPMAAPLDESARSIILATVPALKAHGVAITT